MLWCVQSPGSKQSADNRTPKEQRRLHVIYQSEESSDSEHEYIDPGEYDKFSSFLCCLAALLVGTVDS